MNSKTFYSHGKLLLTGEYLVLDGAKALAVPTKFGQNMVVASIDSYSLHWKSLLHDGATWFGAEFTFENSSFKCLNPSDIGTRLIEILNACLELHAEFKDIALGSSVTTTLEFPENWGLGSSSTLINNIANWAKVDAFQLLEKTFGGSGYDVACAQHATPILYQKTSGTIDVEEVTFQPSFQDELFFVYLNQKQNSRDSIKHYRNTSTTELASHIKHISRLTENILKSTTISDFESLIKSHEQVISAIIKTPPIAAQLFPDYPRAIKSLGGWGGDFVLAVGTPKDIHYFKQKGYDTIIPYSNMIL